MQSGAWPRVQNTKVEPQRFRPDEKRRRDLSIVSTLRLTFQSVWASEANRSSAPTGAGLICFVFPWLAPWAIVCRPTGSPGLHRWLPSCGLRAFPWLAPWAIVCRPTGSPGLHRWLPSRGLRAFPWLAPWAIVCRPTGSPTACAVGDCPGPYGLSDGLHRGLCLRPTGSPACAVGYFLRPSGFPMACAVGYCLSASGLPTACTVGYCPGPYGL